MPLACKRMTVIICTIQFWNHCKLQQHRIGLFDIHDGFSAENHEQNVESFRDNVLSDTDLLKNGAAYYPWARVNVVKPSALSFTNFENGLEDLKKLANSFEAADRDRVIQLIDNSALINTRRSATDNTDARKTIALHQRLYAISPGYQQVIKEMTTQANVLPVAGIIAGFLARADQELGTWLSTYDIPLKGVLEPSIQLSARQQKLLYIDAMSGKSINPIVTDPQKESWSTEAGPWQETIMKEGI
jgi:hypothetical protein